MVTTITVSVLAGFFLFVTVMIKNHGSHGELPYSTSPVFGAASPAKPHPHTPVFLFWKLCRYMNTDATTNETFPFFSLSCIFFLLCRCETSGTPVCSLFLHADCHIQYYIYLLLWFFRFSWQRCPTLSFFLHFLLTRQWTHTQTHTETRACAVCTRTCTTLFLALSWCKV